MTGKTDSIVTQMNIRNNVREMQESFKDLYSWRDEMNQKEEELKKRASGSKSAARTPAVRGKAAPVTAPGRADAKRKRAKKKQAKAPLQAAAPSAAGHTYDHSKKRWDAFDVDAALAEASDGSEYETEGDSEQPIIAQKGADPPIRQKLPPAEAAEVLRSKGNDFFKFGDLARAKECYTTSIDAQPSAAAYANRALMCVKLKEWQQAEADCSQALECDAEYLKAWQRRAEVRKVRGDRRGCLADLDAALRLAPASAAISRELRAVLAAELEERGIKLPAELRTVPVEGLPQAAEAQPDDGSQDAVVAEGAEEAAQPECGGPAGGSRAEPPPAGEPSGDAASGGAEPPPPPPAQEPNQKPASAQGSPLRASRPVSGRSSPLDAPLELPARPLRPPATSSEFEQHWRSCKGDAAAQARYLAVIEPTTLPRVFKSSLTPALLDGIVATLLQQARTGDGGAVVHAEHCVRLLECLSAAERFGMNTMLIPGKRRAQLAEEWAAAALESPPDVAAKLQSLRKVYRM